MSSRALPIALLVAALPTAYAARSAVVSNPVYVRDIAAPAYRRARAVQCRSLTGQSVPVDRSSEDAMERSDGSGMKLLTRQLTAGTSRRSMLSCITPCGTTNWG